MQVLVQCLVGKHRLTASEALHWWLCCLHHSTVSNTLCASL